MTAPARIAEAVDAGAIDVTTADADADDVRAYVDAHVDATLFHDPAWGQAVRRAFGYEQITFAARRHGRIVGVLPLIDVRGRIFGRSLVSAAFSVGGGALANDPVAARALCARAVAEGEARNVRHVELRGGPAPEDWVTKEGVYASFVRQLSADDDAELKAVPRKRRAEIRKALKLADEGRLAVRHDADPDAFYDLYAISLRNLGTPVFSRKFIRELRALFGDRIIFSLVEADGAPVFSLCSFLHRDRVMPYYAGVTPEARHVKAADFGYFSLMGEARARGARLFDFGRSKIGSPHADYKRSWGFEAEALVYRYALIAAKETPNVNPNNPKFRLLTNAWRRLPLPVANALGPIIARDLA